MTTQSYNGWTNWETWNANLHFDGFWKVAQEVYDETSGTPDERKDEWLDSMERRVRYDIEELSGANEATGFGADVLNHYLREINYREIAERYWEDVTVEEET